MGSIMVIRRYKCSPFTTENKRQGFIEEAFIQVCGASSEKAMHIVADSLAPLGKPPYQLCCNCQYCISYSYEGKVNRVTAEPLMKAVNIIFNNLCQCNYILQSSTAVQNLDGSNTTTWVWIRQSQQIKN